MMFTILWYNNYDSDVIMHNGDDEDHDVDDDDHGYI